MKTLNEFDYDLWTQKKNGLTEYWVRVKSTGAVSQVSHEVMKYLRNEEKKMRRQIASTHRHGGSPLSCDIGSVDCSSSAWIPDPIDYELRVLLEDELSRFRLLLTAKQRSVFDECLYEGKSLTKYAQEHGVSISLISKRIRFIRKKAILFFDEVD